MSDELLERRERDMNLLREACRFVRKYEPELVLSENVAGIDDPKYGGVWEHFRRSLEVRATLPDRKWCAHRASVSRNSGSARSSWQCDIIWCGRSGLPIFCGRASCA